MFSEVGIKRRLYNAGERISEILHYSLPDGHDIHCTARFLLEAPEKQFFEIPTAIIIGDARISVQFLETILRPDRYGERGVILVDANWKPPADTEEAERLPVARNDKEAVEKATRHWDGYVKKVAQQWIDQCQQVRSAGGVPTAASGFVIRALRKCGIVDPAQAVVITAGENKSELETLRKQLADQQKLLEQLVAKNGAQGEEAKPAAPVTQGRGGKHQSAAAPRPGQ
jgi:hypothetical protein